MSVFHGKQTADEQPKCGWQTKGRGWGLGWLMHPFGNACTGVQQSVFMAERSGGTLGWKLKCWPAERSQSIPFFWWELWNCFHLLTYVFVRTHSAPSQDEKQERARSVWHTLNGSFLRRDPTGPSMPPQTRWPMFPWMRIAGRWERERQMRQRGEHRGGQRAEEGEAFTGFNHSKTLNSYWGYQNILWEQLFQPATLQQCTSPK